MIFGIYTPEKVTEKAKVLFKHERAKDRLDGWFIAKEKELQIYGSLAEYDEEVKKALIIKEIVRFLQALRMIPLHEAMHSSIRRSRLRNLQATATLPQFSAISYRMRNSPRRELKRPRTNFSKRNMQRSSKRYIPRARAIQRKLSISSSRLLDTLSPISALL